MYKKLYIKLYKWFLLRKLSKVIKKEWNVKIVRNETLLDLPLIEIGEWIACKSEDITLEEAYKLNIGHDVLSLPLLITFTLAIEMGLDTKKVNSSTTLGSVLIPKI